MKTIKDAVDENLDDDDKRMILVLVRKMMNTCIYSTMVRYTIDGERLILMLIRMMMIGVLLVVTKV